jgi:hypothetical protein
MGGRTIAAICSICSAAALAIGCGGSSSSSAPSAALKSRCATALAAEQRYTTALEALSLRTSNERLVRAAFAATEALRSQTEALEHIVAAADKPKLGRFAVALFDQERVLRAFEVHDLATARKFGNGINAPLTQGAQDLRSICAHTA